MTNRLMKLMAMFAVELEFPVVLLRDQGPKLRCTSAILVEECSNPFARAVSKKQTTRSGYKDRGWGIRDGTPSWYGRDGGWLDDGMARKE